MEMENFKPSGCIETHGRGYGIRLNSGHFFFPGSPSVDEFELSDIPHNLSHHCRFAGNTKLFYTVAQHSVHCWEMAKSHCPEFTREALMHDAVEALSGAGDVARPVKREIPILEEWERRIAEVVHPLLGIPVDMSPEVKHIDNTMCATEAVWLLPKPRDVTVEIQMMASLPKPLPWTGFVVWPVEVARDRMIMAMREEGYAL